MPWKKGCYFIKQAIENHNEEKLYNTWLTLLPHMKKSMSFEEFKKKHTKPKVQKTNKTTEELIFEAEKIKNMDLKKGKKSSLGRR